MSAPVLATNDLSVGLGGLPVLRGITFDQAGGEAIALLGGNGSGKSTLVRTLLGLISPERGSVELFGTPVGRFRGWRRVGYVPQRSPLASSNAKVREVVKAGRLAHRRPFVPARRADQVAVAEALAAVDLAERAGDQFAELSGGQQQRVLIARALAGRPDLLVLDEPTAGVDLDHQQVLARLLGDLRANGTAILVVLHEVGPLGALIDRAIVLRDGRVVHDGPLGALGRSPAPHVHHDEHDDPAQATPGLLDGSPR